MYISLFKPKETLDHTKIKHRASPLSIRDLDDNMSDPFAQRVAQQLRLPCTQPLKKSVSENQLAHINARWAAVSKKHSASVDDVSDIRCPWAVTPPPLTLRSRASFVRSPVFLSTIEDMNEESIDIEATTLEIAKRG